MRILTWLLRAIVFFALFAFALNNQEPVVVRWFFGIDWTAPLVIVVVLAFAAGCAAGVLAMLPGRWRSRQPSAPGRPGPAPSAAALSGPTPAGPGGGFPPREGL